MRRTRYLIYLSELCKYDYVQWTNLRVYSPSRRYSFGGYRINAIRLECDTMATSLQRGREREECCFALLLGNRSRTYRPIRETRRPSAVHRLEHRSSHYLFPLCLARGHRRRRRQVNLNTCCPETGVARFQENRRPKESQRLKFNALCLVLSKRNTHSVHRRAGKTGGQPFRLCSVRNFENFIVIVRSSAASYTHANNFSLGKNSDSSFSSRLCK